MADKPVLLAFDGSPGSVAALEAAAGLLGPRPASVVSIWSPIATSAPVAGGAPIYLSDLDPQLEQNAREQADEGARVAQKAGFDADAHTASSPVPWQGIVEMAETLDAAVIVVGARGLSALKSVLLGSTSNGVLHHTKRPVLVFQTAESEDRGR